MRNVKPIDDAVTEGIDTRSCAEITRANIAAEAPIWQGARRARTRRYVTDERRSKRGWIGGEIAQVISEQRLNLFDSGGQGDASNNVASGP